MINHYFNLGALKLNTANIKHQLSKETRIWKVLYSNKIHKLARDSMARLFEFFQTMSNKLNIEVNSLDTLRYVMMVLKEVREKESSIEMDISPIMDMYFILDHYLPGDLTSIFDRLHSQHMCSKFRRSDKSRGVGAEVQHDVHLEKGD